MNKHNFFTTLVLIFIAISAFLIRVYRLNLNIPPLYADEVGGAYITLGKLLQPNQNILLKMYHWLYYGTSTLTWFFGLNPFGVRIASAFYGSLIPLAVYWLALKAAEKELEKQSIAVLAALLSAILPWSFMVSRLQMTQIPIIVILTCLSAVFYLKGEKIKNYFLSILFLLIGAYYYASMVFIAPAILFIIVIQLFRLSDQKQKKYFIGLSIVSILLIGLILELKYHELSFRGRGADLAIWNDVNITADTNLYRGIARQSSTSLLSLNQNPELVNKFFYNYTVAVGQQFVKNYLSFFSPEFLLLRGDPVLRHSTGQVGAFFPLFFPFMIYGAFIFFTSNSSKTDSSMAKNKSTVRKLFFFWILVSPIPAALTNDGAGYLLRSITMMPFLTYFCALGIVKIKSQITNIKVWKFKRRIKFSPILYDLGILFIIIYSGYYFLFGYFHVYPTIAAESFEYGFKELSDFQQIHNDESMLVIWKGYYPALYFRFWQQTPFSQFNELPLQLKINSSFFYQSHENLFFSWPKTAEDLDNFLKNHRVQWIIFPTNFLDDNIEYMDLLEQTNKTKIYFPDGKVSFTIFQN